MGIHSRARPTIASLVVCFLIWILTLFLNVLKVSCNLFVLNRFHLKYAYVIHFRITELSHGLLSAAVSCFRTIKLWNKLKILFSDSIDDIDMNASNSVNRTFKIMIVNIHKVKCFIGSDCRQKSKGKIVAHV